MIPSGDTSALRIETNFVYMNDSGEQRLVVALDCRNTNAVVVWRTTDPKLPDGAKAQGSATLGSFQRWAKTMREATKADVIAFEEVEFRRRWMRKERRYILKNRQLRAQGR